MIISDTTSFQTFFEKMNKDVVLFFDEFDVLLGSPFIDEFLGTLRTIKQGKDTGIFSVVIIGPLNVLNAANRNYSPFNVSVSESAPYFDSSECKSLFQEFSENAGITLESGIVEDIFSRTSGHPGLVCFCGKKIQEELLLDTNLLTLQQWREFALFSLPRLVLFQNFNLSSGYCHPVGER